MEAKKTVLTKTGQQRTWTFTECYPNPDDYGNKKWVAVKDPNGETFLIDCRYMKDYNFNKVYIEYLQNYYGENLRGILA